MREKLSLDRTNEIRTSVISKYEKVAVSPEGLFSYPVGQESALKLGYEPSWISSVPTDLVSRFVGVGNPFTICLPKPGDWVLDAGCGCGFDTFIAASLAGPSGRAIGIDLTGKMLAVPRTAAASFTKGNVEFQEGSLEGLPFENSFFDLIISNGALNLVPDKERAFAEIARVLRPGGTLAAADLLVIEDIPQDVLENTDAWST